jgi:hydrogenase maturation protein HypF
MAQGDDRTSDTPPSAPAGDERAIADGGDITVLVVDDEPRILETLASLLEREGFRVLSHAAVPPNDGGVSYGQAAVAAARLACA